MTDLDGTTMYWGCVGGSMSKALRHMEEPHVMVSYASTAKVWDWIEHSFLDSGGYSLMLDTGEHPPTDTYMDYVEDKSPTQYAVQDYPCEPEILDKYGRTVEQHQELTLERTAECLAQHQDRGIDSEIVSVVQGWDKSDYLSHIDRLRDHGCLTDTVGVGSICRRGQDQEITDVLKAVREALPARCDIHAFGVKTNILSRSDIRQTVDSVDSAAWYYQMYKDKPVDEPAWHTCVHLYLEYRRGLYEKFGLYQDNGQEQTDLAKYA